MERLKRAGLLQSYTLDDPFSLDGIGTCSLPFSESAVLMKDVKTALGISREKARTEATPDRPNMPYLWLKGTQRKFLWSFEGFEGQRTD